MSYTDDFIARALLAYNSDLTIPDNHGNKPSKIAKIRKNQNLVDTLLYYENRDERPDREEICLEIAQRQVSENQKTKIISYRNNERAKRKFLSNSKPTSTSQNSNLNSINDEENHRIQDLESKIEELNDSMTKLKAKVLSSPQSALLTKSNQQCHGCLSTHTSICPICKLPYCEVCMQKPKFHKCAEKH